MAETKTITLKIQSDVLVRIDEAAEAAGMNRSAFMRNCTLQVMDGAVPNRYAELDQINVIDNRARDVIRSVLQRLDRLEKAQFGGSELLDPFA